MGLVGTLGKGGQWVWDEGTVFVNVGRVFSMRWGTMRWEASMKRGQGK